MITVGDSVAERIAAIARSIAEYTESSGKTLQRINTCLEAIESSAWPDVAWRFSGLNMDGSPVEFAFSSFDNKLRYTSEVAGPEVDTHARIDAACRLIARLGYPALLAEQAQYWKSLQFGQPLRWGAWLSLRDDSLAARLKLYIEVPASKRGAATTTFRPWLTSSELLMVGYYPELDASEYYFRQPALDNMELDCLLTLLTMSEPRRSLLAAFSDLCGMPSKSALRWTNFGYSLTYLSAETEPQVTLGIRSRTLPAVGKVRERLLKCEERSGKSRSAYRDLLVGLKDSELPDHGIISLTANQGCNVEMRIGLSGLALTQLYSSYLDGQESPLLANGIA